MTDLRAVAEFFEGGSLTLVNGNPLMLYIRTMNIYIICIKCTFSKHDVRKMPPK